MIGSSIWPKRFDAVVPVPLTVRCQPIRGLEWGAEGIDKETRNKGVMAEITNVGSEVFRIRDMISSQDNTNSGHALAAMIARIDAAITKRKPDPMSFKIGITWNPPYRWAKHEVWILSRKLHSNGDSGMGFQGWHDRVI